MKAERLAASGLAIAASTILALALLVLAELDREAKLHRDVIAQLAVKDLLENLRANLSELGHAARIAALTGTDESLRKVDGAAVDVEGSLASLARQPSRDDRFAMFDGLAQAARALLLNARSIKQTRAARGAAAAESMAREAERIATEASEALDRTLDSQAGRINERTLAQLQAGETLRAYVAWLLAGSAAVLVGLFWFYREAAARARQAMLRIEHLAHFDAVTALPNRSLLIDRLEREVARAQRSERAFAVLLLDLDGFKKVNDTWGHAAGDRVLWLVAERSRQCMRASDTIGRLGGDEFLAILPETSLEGAAAVAEKLRAALEKAYPLEKATAKLSASIGVSLYPAHGADAEALQRTADAALYRAKREGRNRVVVATAVVPAGDKAQPAERVS
ncbi:MAG: diguanylate cyclase [Usitatibacter sp.]